MRLHLVCLLLLASLPACTTWYVREGISLKEVIATEHPNAVRLTRANGSSVVVEQLRFVGSDSLAGVHNGVYFNLAVADVTEVATQRISKDDTIMVVTFVALGVGMLTYALVPRSGPDEF
jgi:hypothetical protein